MKCPGRFLQNAAALLVFCVLLTGCDDPKKAKEQQSADWVGGREFADKRTVTSFTKSMNMEVGRGNTKGAKAIGDALSRWRLEAEK